MRPFLHFYDQAAEELSRITRYYDELIQIDHPFADNETAFEKAICKKKTRVLRTQDLEISHASDQRTVVLMNAALNYSLDIEGILNSVYSKLDRNSRLALLSYNPYFASIFKFFARIKLIRSRDITTFVTLDGLENLAKLTSFEIVRIRSIGIFPFHLFGLGNYFSRALSAMPILKWFTPASLIILRPIIASPGGSSLSIIIPARNEAGNVQNFISRLPDFGHNKIEIIIVEGNSTDNTWDEIQKLKANYTGPYQVRTLKQTAKGKNNAVREGFDIAEGDLLTILDADLTMPPELLPRFYDAYQKGLGDFVNGSRLIYPMEGEAMRPLNKLGNIFFVKALNFCLENKISDSLCGTKLISRADYIRLKNWRKHFGDFDPFGDFELLFFASIMGLGIIDVPVYYRARTYGETNIRRFRDGWILLKMTATALLRIKM